jgi:predicted signal transduction protein with EAL and GGDEF domain
VPSLAGYDSTEILLSDADIAMYQATRRGKGLAVRFEPVMHAVAEAPLHIENDLRLALDNREFEVEYQPILDLRFGMILAIEALVRWRTRLGMLLPMLSSAALRKLA